MAVDDAGLAAGNRNVRQQARHQSCTHSRSVHGRDDGLAAIDEVVDQVLGLMPDPRARIKIIGNGLDQRQIATAGESLAQAAQDGNTGLRVGIDISPHLRQFAMAIMVGRGQTPLLAHQHFQHALGRTVETQCLVRLKVHAGLCLAVALCQCRAFYWLQSQARDFQSGTLSRLLQRPST